MTGSRVILITGGAGGMGRAIAARFVDAGETVVLSDRSVDSLASAVAEVPGIASTVVTDVASVTGCLELAETTAARHGGIDVLVTAAGVWVEGPSSSMTELD